VYEDDKKNTRGDRDKVNVLLGVREQFHRDDRLYQTAKQPDVTHGSSLRMIGNIFPI
jgi:hypothetical protein